MSQDESGRDRIKQLPEEEEQKSFLFLKNRSSPGASQRLVPVFSGQRRHRADPFKSVKSAFNIVDADWRTIGRTKADPSLRSG
jgi:hypothetical protein